MSLFSSIKKAFKKVVKPIQKALPIKKTLRALAPALGAIPGIGAPLSAGLTTILNVEKRLTNKTRGKPPPAVSAGRQLATAFRVIRPRQEQQLRPIVAGKARFAPQVQRVGAFEQGRRFFRMLGKVPPPPIPTSPGEAGVAAFGALIPRVAGGAMAAARAPGLVFTTTGVIRGVQTASGFFNRRRMVQLAKTVGLEAAAAALGITVVQLATAVGDEQRRPRRRRGISGRDLATTRRTIRAIKSMACQIGVSTAAPRRRATRAKTCR